MTIADVLLAGSQARSYILKAWRVTLTYAGILSVPARVARLGGLPHQLPTCSSMPSQPIPAACPYAEAAGSSRFASTTIVAMQARPNSAMCRQHRGADALVAPALALAPHAGTLPHRSGAPATNRQPTAATSMSIECVMYTTTGSCLGRRQTSLWHHWQWQCRNVAAAGPPSPTVKDEDCVLLLASSCLHRCILGVLAG
jgi:hypothetical protein